MEILDHFDRDRIAALLARDEFFWLDLLAPSDEELTLAGEVFSLHPLALEDSRTFEQRPKLDEYSDQVLLVFYGVHHDEMGPQGLVEVHLHVSGSWVLTIHRDPCAHLGHARRLAREGKIRSEEYVVYKIIDSLTDSYFPLLERLDDAIDEIEDSVAVEATMGDRQRIFAVKRELVALRQRVGPQRDMLAAGGELLERLPGFEVDKVHDYFRDVYDHLIRISEAIDSYRELLSGALEVYLSTESNRLNQMATRLTIIATIFLPLTVVTGFFGQNFGWLVNHIHSGWTFVVFGIGGLLTPIAVVLMLLRRAGYFERLRG
jgi:magnesium transporter